MKFPNHDFLASLAKDNKTSQHLHLALTLPREWLRDPTLRKCVTYSGLDSGVRLDMSSDVGTGRKKDLTI